LPQHRRADAVLRQFVGDWLRVSASRWLAAGEPVALARASMRTARLRVSRTRCAALAITACASGVRFALNSSKKTRKRPASVPIGAQAATNARSNALGKMLLMPGMS